MLSKLLQKNVKKTLIPIKISCDSVLKNRLNMEEKIIFKTSDGIKLSGNWYQGTNNRTVIFSHSFGSNRFGWFEEGYDDTIDMVPSIKIFIDAGYNIFLFDHRACGESEGSITSFGKNETLDIKAAFNWVRENKQTSTGDDLSEFFVFIGFSTGANATLNAIDELEKVESVKIVGILSNIYWYAKMFPNSVNYFTSLPNWLVPTLNKSTQDILDFAPNTEINPLRVAPKIKSPLLFVGSEQDMIARIEDIKVIYNSVNSYKEMLVLKGERFDSYHFIEKNEQEVFDFINKGFAIDDEKNEKIAVLTIEYQKSWTDKGFFFDLIKKEYKGRNVLKNTQELLGIFRERSIDIVHAPLIINKEDKFRYKKTPFPARLFKQLTYNTWKSEMSEGILKEGDSVVLGRSSYDACIDSDLVDILESKKIERVILCGFTTDHCIKETYDSLSNKGFKCVIADDCTATLSRKKQNQIKSFYPLLSNEDIYTLIN